MIRRPPRSTRTDTLFPYTTLFRSVDLVTFEFESVPSETVAFLSQFVPVYPSAEALRIARDRWRSEEHTSELQSLMRISYAVFCLKKKTKKIIIYTHHAHL